MRLISFAVISFLAITVSAVPPWTNLYQSLRSPPSTTTQSEQQCDQKKVEAELARLWAAYEKKRESIAPIEAKYKINKQNAMDAGNRVDSIIDGLEEPSINDDEISELDQQYHVAKAKWIDLATKYNKHYRYYVKIRKGREDARIALELLLENQKRTADYNDTHDVKTGPSLGSCYNLGLLKGQIGHIPKEIEGLLAKWEKIKVDEHLSKDDLKTWKAEIKDGIRRCEKRYEIVKEILREHEHSQPIGVQARKFINLLLPNARVE
ncbi:hypothetical protein BASA50_005334 [Batrachochytrium salamandrivorans]|uniref:Secreted protein n=1 Tax=Batrachochytrium salamandrivorans TaxID=1357716 RepID=A0ABQ8FDD1_9FUNG|nr:hypothetical protein BASA50_005334 [Batrachochytrium salamandrivorans]